MPPEAGFFDSMVKAFGWPGAILVLVIIGVWRAWKFVMPWAEKMFQAYISRQQVISASQKELADKTMVLSQQSIDLSKQSISIQQTVAKSVESIPAAIERLLRAVPSQDPPKK